MQSENQGNGNLILTAQDKSETPMSRSRGSGLQKEVDLSELWRILKKWKYLSAVCVILFLAASVMACLLMPWRYEATARIDVDLTSPTGVDDTPAATSSAGADPETRLESQVSIIETDSIAWDVIRKLRLDQRASFTGSDQVSGPRDDIDKADPWRRMVLLKMFHSATKVELVPRTEIIEVRFRDRDPVLAAATANAIADRYIETTFRNRYSASMQAADWLTKQVEDLRLNVQNTQQLFSDYQKEKGIILTDDLTSVSGNEAPHTSGNIVIGKLDELNRALTNAEADRILKESRYRITLTRDPGLISGITPSSALDDLRKSEADLKSDYAKENAHYGPSFPRMAQMRKQLDAVHAEIETEMSRLAEMARNDYEVALKNEKSLTAALENQKQEAFRRNGDAITLEVLKRDADTSRDIYESVVKKLKMAGVTAGLRGTNLTLVDAAHTPAKHAEPRVGMLLGLGLFGGIFFGIALSFGAESLDMAIHTPEDVDEASGMPTLGIIPHSPAHDSRPVIISNPNSPSAEAFRVFRSALLLSRPGSPPKVIVITSSLPKEGKSTVALNTAIALAKGNHKTLLIDADMRRPSIHKKLGLERGDGLSEILAGANPSRLVHAHTEVPTLDVLTAGHIPPNPAELLQSAKMFDFLAECSRNYEQVIVDCPPLLGMADSVVLASVADAVVVIARSTRTRRNSLRRACDLLRKMNAPLIGVLVNDVNINSETHYQYYGYYGKQYGQYYLKDRK
jgi:capsular exopolysaccharide synthesis family protein